MAALSFDDLTPNAGPQAAAAQGADSPYLPLIESLENSQGAADAYNAHHPGATVNADTVVSPAGAIGRYQIMPGTAKQYGFDPNNLHDPDYNRMAAATILNDLSRRFHNDPQQIAIAYNGGPGRVETWLKANRNDAVLPAETQGYVARARAFYGQNGNPAPQQQQGPLSFDDMQPKGPLTFDDLSQSQPAAAPKPVGKDALPGATPDQSWLDVLKPDFMQVLRRSGDSLLKAAQAVSNGAMVAHPSDFGDWLASVSHGTTPEQEKALTAQAFAKLQERNAPFNAWAGKVRGDLEADIKENAPNIDQHSMQGIVYQGLVGAGQAAPALAVGLATKNPLLAGSMLGAQAGGEQYAQSLQQGRTREQAAMDGQISGLVNSALGALPMGVLMDNGGTFLSRTLKSAGANAVQGVLSEAFQIGYDKGIIDPKTSLKDAIPRLVRAGIIGAIQGALLSGGHGAVESIVGRIRSETPKPEPRVEPKPASPPPATAQPQPTPNGDLLRQIGLDRPGILPQPSEGASAPVTAPQDTQGTYRTTPAAIRNEHDLQVAQLEREGMENLAKSRQQLAAAPPVAGQEALQPGTAGIPHKEVAQDVAVTPTGRQVPVRYAMVEAHHLTPSQTRDGMANPAYPAELQPRDRARAVSQAQVASITQNINPRLLDRSPTAGDGAPIVSTGGIVESGNGRTLALQRAYDENLPTAQGYRDYLESQGYPVQGFDRPMLVRIRNVDMTPEERQAFTREANQPSQLGMSATERAMTDAANIPDHILDSYRGGDVDAAQNRDFVRNLMSLVPENERAALVDSHGNLSQEAVRRVQGALLAKAYGDPGLVGGIIENPDTNIKAIGGALTDVSADWARMRGRANAGQIPASLDQTAKLLDAVNLVKRARDEGRNVAEYVSQPDIFTGETVDPDTEAWLRLMFRNTNNWTGPVGRERLADAMRFYAQEALKTQAGPNLFGSTPVEPADVLATAKGRQYATGERQASFGESAPVFAGQSVREGGDEGAGPLFAAAADRGSQASAPNSAQADALARGELIEGTYGPRPERFVYDLPSTPRAQPLNDEVQRYIADTHARTPSEIASALANFIHGRGLQSGVEALAGYDAVSGKVLGYTTNDPRSVAFSKEIFDHLDNPANAFVSLHNHPSSTAPSLPDLGSLLFPGHAHLLIAAHDGSWYGARMSAELPDGQHVAGAQQGLKEAYKAAERVSHAAVNRDFQKNILNSDEAVKLHWDIVNRALDRAGITEYATSRTLPERHEQTVEDAANAAAKTADPWKKWFQPQPRSADDLGGRAQPVRFADGVAQIFGRLGAPAEQAGGARSAGEGAEAAQRTQHRTPEQLKLLEGDGHAPQSGLFESPDDRFGPTPTTVRAAIDNRIGDLSSKAMDLVHDFQKLIAPMAIGSDESRATATDYSNLMRLASWHGRRMMKAMEAFTPEQRKAMWEAADEESVARQQGKSTEGIGLSRLPENERNAVLSLQTDAQSVWNAARELGMVKGEGLPSYVPRILVEMGETGAKRLGSDRQARSVPGIGRELITRTSQMLGRKHLTTEETEGAASAATGKAASVIKDIRTLPYATMRLREAMAGRGLINKIKEIGARTGEATVVEGNQPAGTPFKWFTMEHPAFKTWRPKFITDDLTGKTTQAIDQNGQPIFEKVPLYVRDDFEGPLRAVMSEQPNKVYSALMGLKGKAMSAIMYSPLIHNMVEFGRAFPGVSPWKMLTGQIYFRGNAAKNDPAQMSEAIMHGMVPITGHFGAHQELSDMANPENIAAGRSWTAKVLGAIPNLFDPRAGQAVYRAIDQLGDFWHNTLLWDRVADLQMGLYTNFRDSLVKKGVSPSSAKWVAAHLANRYAGALPREAMSEFSRKLANLTLFSRTYTLGNLGAMKDVVSGLPRNIQAKIAQEGGLEELQSVRSLARRKAIAILATDMALFYAGNSLLQSAMQTLSGREDWKSAFERDYVRRFDDLLRQGKESPLSVLNPLSDIQALTSQADNEPDRDTGQPIQRVLVGFDRDGTAIYARNPFGKIGEEFAGWLQNPFDMLKRKLGTFARPTWETMTNDAGYGRHVYDPDGTVTSKVGSIIWEYMKAQIPEDSLVSAYREARGKAQTIDAYKVLGPLAGVTFRKGAPGGPAVGEMYQLKREHDARIASAMPDIIEQIKGGDIKGARTEMRSLGLSPRLQNYYVRTTLNPRLRLETREMRQIMQEMPADERARIQRLRENHP